MLRGDIDQICEHTNDKQIDTVDVLEPNEDGQSLRVVVHGPPGIGKTTLCRKLLNLWAKEELKQHYELVLYCQLRNIKIAQAVDLNDLLIYQYYGVSEVIQWIISTKGDKLLIIFDGWDELNIELRQTSLAAQIIRKERLQKCSVIVTSRSYASSSLLKLNTISKHIEVKGFSKEEVNDVIQCTLPQLKKEIEIQNDVQSLCYIPLVCSIVANVCKSSEGQLPKTLTKLYKKFIVETINRHVEIKQIPAEITVKLSNLPLPINNIFLKLCKLAYDNLKQNPPKLTFSSSELPEDYLGLMTSFAEYGFGKKTYQFLHLSIQEFLAAWWITKYEKTEELFKDHFENDHLRLCLRFVAGLTHLEHKSYQQYFNKPIDLQCKRKPLFSYDTMYLSWFHQNPEIVRTRHLSSHTVDIFYDKFDVLLLQLLYESQNTTLCHILAQSINNQSLCLYGLSLFDILCLSYFLNNSNITWKYLDLGRLNEQEVQILTNTLTNNSQHNQCKILQVYLDEVSMEQVIKLFQLPFFHNIQQCYITLGGYQQDLLYKLLLSLIQLHQLKILHLYLLFADQSPSTIGQYSEMTKFLEINCMLQKLLIGGYLPIYMANDIVNGVANNKSITSFTLCSSSTDHELSDETIQHLLNNNHTLQTLDIYNELSSSLNIVEVNTPLTAMGLNLLHFPHIKGLQYLKLYHSHQPHLIFHSYPNLQQLDISIDTAESVNKLFTILQSNTTLKALRVKLKNKDIYSSIGNSLRDMLTLNQTIQCLEIDAYAINYISSTYMSYLTTGLSYNNSLQELSVLIPLSNTNNQQLQTYFNVISQKYHLTELKVYFTLDQSYSNISNQWKEHIMTSLHYELGLPLVTNMLKLHTSIRLLHVECYYIKLYDLFRSQWIDSIKHLLQTVFLHPSLEYIGIQRTQLLQDTFKVQMKTHHLLKSLPIVDLIAGTCIFHLFAIPLIKFYTAYDLRSTMYCKNLLHFCLQIISTHHQKIHFKLVIILMCQNLWDVSY